MVSHLSRRKLAFGAAVAISLSGAPKQANALTFNFTDVTPGGMAPAALAGFNQAAAIWEAIVSDPITVNVNISFSTLPAGVLGGASSVTMGATYDAVRTALTGDSTSADDATAVANLPGGTALSFLTNNPNTSAVEVDNNGSANNVVLNVNRANAKALGLLGATDGGNDASVSFSDAFTWDFDQTDGINAGAQDFVGVSVHELGHALGFVSGVDTVDATHGSGPSAPDDLNGFRVHTVFDLFRYSAAGQLNYATGGTPYFSLDGGTTSLATFSTGAFNGDGRQASHWKDNLGFGLMDPTANPPGQINTLSALDLRAFDVIGFTIVPEPSAAAFVILMGTAMACRRRRR